MIFFHRNFEKMFNISIYLNPHLQMLNNLSQPLYLHDRSVGIVSINMQSGTEKHTEWHCHIKNTTIYAMLAIFCSDFKVPSPQATSVLAILAKH